MKVELPEQIISELPNGEFDYYGASNILSQYCGIDFTTKPMSEIGWLHGWMPDFWNNIHPLLLTGQSSENKDQNIFTSKRNVQLYLKECGYKNIESTGLPIVYVKEKKIDRIKDSLLVMPIHSLSYTTSNHLQFDEYVAQIEAISKNYKQVNICIHPSCIKLGYWVTEFKAKGFHIIEGANVFDKNAFYRLQMLMSSFEYVTSNAFGSHIPYAAYFGAKPSIYGTYAEYKEEDLLKEPFFVKNPELTKKTLQLYSRDTVFKELGQFFVEPHEAKACKDWANYELGWDNKKTPKEIRELLEWSYTSSFLYESKRNIGLLLESIGIKSYVKKILGKS